MCGKLAIVQSILKAERRSALYVDPIRNDDLDLSMPQLQEAWYVPLMRAITESAAKDNFDELFSNLTFVIFNYDRCVEVFLYRALRRYYGVSANAASSLLNKVNFLHPYGVVGKLTWQTGDGLKIGYGAEVNSRDLLELSSGIRTFSERVDAGEFLDLMRSEMALADTIVYLGFSYHPQNMELLSVDGAGRARRVFGSAYGISESDKNVIKKSIVKSLKPTALDIPVELPDITCARLFGEYSRSITQ